MQCLRLFNWSLFNCFDTKLGTGLALIGVCGTVFNRGVKFLTIS